MTIPRRRIFARLVVVAAAASALAQGQEYADYGEGQEYGGDYQDYAGDYAEQDNLYHDYAMKQQDKAAGGAGGGPGFAKILACAAGGWFVGAKVHTKRVTRALKAKHKAEHKALYTQYYDDVYKLQQSNAQLADAVEQLQNMVKKAGEDREIEALQRDYDEFKQPDIDGDDRISRAEFNMYVKNYLSNYPGLAEEDYPKYEDFDHDGDGYINFQEYAQQMALQVQKAEKKAGKAR